MADLTPEALAAEIYQAAWQVCRAAGLFVIPWEDLTDPEQPRPAEATAVAEGWLAAARAAMDRLAPAHAALAAERDGLERDLNEQEARWPKCPDGCGCRLGGAIDGVTDADARECGCDGPCCMECRENGYPDAPSYRDLAVRHVMDDLDEARKLIDALREDNHGLIRAARYEAALVDARSGLHGGTDPVAIANRITEALGDGRG